VTLGVPYLGPYNINSPMNPIRVVCMGLGYSQLHTATSRC